MPVRAAWFRDRPLGQKFLLAFGGLFVLLAAGFLAVLFLVGRLNSYVDRHQRITVPAVVTAGQMQRLVLEGRGDAGRPARLDAVRGRLHQELAVYREAHAARTHPILFGMLQDHGRVDLADREDEAMARISAGLAQWNGTDDRELLTAMSALVEAHIAIDREMKAEGDRLQRQATVVIAALAMALGLLVVAMYVVVTRAIARPLQRVAAAAGRVARHDLNAEFDAWPAGDEVGTLTRSLSAMLSTLRDRTRALERKTGELEAFTYSVAHDLKGPLREIEGFAALVGRRGGQALGDDAHRHLAMIRAAALRMTRLIDALLQYSRLEQQALPKTAVNLATLVADAIAEQPEAHAGTVRIAAEVPALTIQAEPTSLHQALRNLLDNAVKFSRGASAPEVTVGAAQQHGLIRLWVRDNGVGFDSANAGRIFKLFERLHGETEYEGTGVGLAIVKLVVEKHGGRVWADSSPGKGATFYLEVPAA